MDEITPEQIEAIARRVDEAASDYREVARKMREYGIAAMKVTGFDTLQRATLSRLESPVASARRSLKSIITEISIKEAKQDVQSAMEQLEAKRKKKKS